MAWENQQKPSINLAIEQNLSEILSNYSAIEAGRSANIIDIFFSYRILLGRMPSYGEVKFWSENSGTWREFINNLLSSSEFSNKLDFLPSGIRLMSEANGFRFWFDSTDREMGVRMACASYEPRTTELIKKIITPGMICLDIGAQTGFFTCLIAKLVGSTGKVIAFEPMDRSFEMLCMNIAENKFEDRVTVRHVACSDSSGMMSVGVQSNMIVADSKGCHQIKCVRLDDENAIDYVNFVKIDIEGHEPKAIRGMSNLLKRSNPIVISEVNQYWLAQAGSSANEYLALLSESGYKILDIDGGYCLLSRPTFDDLENINILAVPDIRYEEVLKCLN